MKLFICWSGARSRAFAEILKTWLPKALGNTMEPKVSMDISKGAVWFEELSGLLAGARAGVICVTPEALHSPWIHYEAGVLTKALGDTRKKLAQGEKTHHTRLFTFLHGVEVSELQGPLAAFQSTSAKHPEDTQRLLQAIVELMPENTRGKARQWEQRFEGLWSDLQEELGNIPPAPLETIFRGLADLFKRKTFHEPIRDCVNQNWLARYDGVQETLNTVRDQREQVRRACGSFTIDVYEALIEALSSYAMATSLLIGKDPFPIDERGRVLIHPPGIARACEQRRIHIKTLLCHLLDPKEAPVLEEAFKFEHVQTFAEKKNLIHRKSIELEKPSGGTHAGMPKEQWAALPKSHWNFDRIMYYVHQEAQIDHELTEELHNAQRELEKVRAKPKGASLMPLHYSLGPLIAALDSTSGDDLKPHRQELSKLMNEIRQHVEATSGDQGGQLRSRLLEIEQLLAKRQRE